MFDCCAPFAPVGWPQHDGFLAFRVDPPVEDTTAWKRGGVHLALVDHSQFKVAVKYRIFSLRVDLHQIECALAASLIGGRGGCRRGTCFGIRIFYVLAPSSTTMPKSLLLWLPTPDCRRCASGGTWRHGVACSVTDWSELNCGDAPDITFPAS